MAVPLAQTIRVGTYIAKQKLAGNTRYPLVMMLEPLFRCNLACVGCGKIDYPDAILNKRLTYEECMDAIDECGAPMVSIAGGEPLLHKDLPRIVEGFIAKKKYVILCTNALLLTKKIDLFKPSPYFSWSIHLDGDQQMHDKSVCQEGVYDIAIAAIKLAKSKGFRTQINCTLFDGAEPDRVAKFFDTMTDLGIDGMTISPGYSYERAPNQQHFLNRTKTKNLFRDIFKRGRGGKAWKFTHSGLFLDFLAGNQTYECTPWSMPARTVFGWQKPCYLVGEGYVNTFKELIDGTDWDSYGVGNYEKCANCMTHCGFEGTAVTDAFKNPLKLVKVTLQGPKTEGPMAPEIPLDKQRPAQYVFEKQVKSLVAEMGQEPERRAKAS